MKTTITGLVLALALALALGSTGCPQRVLTKPSGYQTLDKSYFYIIENVAGQSSKILKCTINADNSANCAAQIK
jgi:hypothetical protein